MGYYINIDDGKINGGSELDNSRFATETNFQVEVSKELYEDCMNEPLKYIYSNGSIVSNPNYEADKQAQEREELNHLSLTKREVFLALYKDKGITPEQIKASITSPEALIEFEYATEYFRGNPLIDAIGTKLGYTTEDLDYLFQNGELP